MYGKFKFIDGEERLTAFFNHLMLKLSYMRQLVAPESFRKEKEIASFQDEKFCDFCRYETWMHAVVERLREWDGLLDEYFGEFCGSWQYYEKAKAKEFYRETSEEPLDCDMSEAMEEHLFTIISDLYMEDTSDIVQNTVDKDIAGFRVDLLSVAQIDMLANLKKHLGCNVESYVVDDDGEMHELTAEEHDLDMAMQKVEAEDDSELLKAVAESIGKLMTAIRACDHESDNTERLRAVHKATKALLAMKITKVSKELAELHEEDNNIGEGTH